MLHYFLYRHTPESLRPWVPRPKVLAAILTAVLTWAALAVAEAAGVDLRAQIPLLGQLLAGKVLTWAQAINTLAPLIAAYLTREAQPVLLEGEPADGDPTSGDELLEDEPPDVDVRRGEV
jgi:hypothetical protein